ncbi:MAG: RND transporter [Pirellulaceae bacterium]|nr:MAG: RND transporter [Pirellulaceae bacterium]
MRVSPSIVVPWRHQSGRLGRFSGVKFALLVCLLGLAATGGHRNLLAAEDAVEPQEEGAAVIQLDAQQIASAGIDVMACRVQPFGEAIEVTGRVAINEDRLAHVYPMVSGLVDSVDVQLGDDVESGQLLALIHSREVGQAKLDLYQARLQRNLAKLKLERSVEITRNTLELLEALKQGMSLAEVERRFRDRRMGQYRAQLLSAYAAYLKSEADVQRLQAIRDTGAVAEKTILAAITNRNADQAAFQAVLEETSHELELQELEASQRLQEAETRVAVAETSLRILGVDEAQISDVDPEALGEAISDYPIRAPFDGTVITKDIVLREQVRPDKLLFAIADLTQVWIIADIFEEHIPLLHNLDGAQIEVFSNAWSERTFVGTVFYTGDVVDDATRSVGLRARADNHEGLLKPGMFVTVRLPDLKARSALVVPTSAIQRHDNQTFVFVQLEPGKYQRRDVQVAESTRTLAAIAAGLKEGELVVTRGAFVLKSLMLSSLLEE